MNIDALNRKRKRICALSLTLTILIMIVGGIMIILGMHNTYFFVGGPVFIIVFLFLLSKFLIMPKYEDLRIEIIKNIFSIRKCNYQISKSKEKFDELGNFYDNKYLKLSTKQQIAINNVVYKFVDFDLMQKKGLKNYYSDLSGKIIKFDNLLKIKEPFAFILSNNQESDKYITFLKDNFRNINENITSIKRYKPYTALYNDYLPIEILNVIDEIDGFNCIISNENEIIIISLEKRINLEFRLQDELTNNNLVDYKNAINSLLRILEKTNKFMEENGNV
jgi:hypothetical protein